MVQPSFTIHKILTPHSSRLICLKVKENITKLIIQGSITIEYMHTDMYIHTLTSSSHGSLCSEEM